MAIGQRMSNGSLAIEVPPTEVLIAPPSGGQQRKYLPCEQCGQIQMIPLWNEWVVCSPCRLKEYRSREFTQFLKGTLIDTMG